jgi:hypothetical protein
MPRTYEPIATTTLVSAAADITFSSIPATYTDLVLVISTGSNTATNRQLNGQFNADTGSNYSATLLNGDGSSALSSRASNNTFMFLAAADGTGSSLGVTIMHFMNYSNTTTNKTMFSRDNNAGYEVRAYVNLWRSTAAINSIKLYLNADSLRAGTVATLYGIKSA